MKLKNYVLFFMLISYCCLEAQEFRNFTTEEGLPSNEVYDVFQDKNGAVWMATDRGLCQYNGYEFKKYAPKDGLTDITIFDFFPQENGQVWCSTFNKRLFYFENGSHRFVPYQYNHRIKHYLEKYPGSILIIRYLFIDKKGTLFISNGGQMFFSIDNQGKITEFTRPYHNQKERFLKDKSPRYVKNAFFNKGKEEFFYATKDESAFKLPSGCGVQRNLIGLGEDKKLLIADSLVQVLSRRSASITVFKGKTLPVSGGKMANGHFWIGYRNNGLKIYNATGKCIASYLPHATVTNFITDCYGGLWISTTDYGVYYLPKDNIRRLSMENNVIHSLTKNDKNHLFIGTYNGDVYEKPFEQPIRKFMASSASSPAYVQFFERERQVVSSHASKLFLDKALISNAIVPVTKISDDNPRLLSMAQYGLYTLWEKESRVTDTVNFRIHDISKVGNSVYFGTIEGLRVKDKGKVISLQDPLFRYRMDDLDYCQEKGILYAATLGKGVLVYHLTKGYVFAIDKLKGLSDDIVTEIYIENANTIWACTNYGLNRIRFTGPRSYTVDYITAANGLLSNQIKDVEIIGNNIYIGTSKGLCVVAKDQFERFLSPKHYFLRLKEVVINNGSYPMGKKSKLQLDHDENQIDFWVEAVSFSGKEKIAYRYKLEGLDKSWKETRERKLSYAYIPPGDYKLVVKVMDDGRSFSTESLVIPIHIDKPFWETYWFLGLVSILFGTIIYFFFKIRVLTYNQDIVRELLRLLLKKMKMRDNFFSFREGGKEIRIRTSDILFIQSSGNYIDIVTASRTYTVRGKIGDFVSQVQDPLEFLRIHRSYIVRIDKIEQKSKKSVCILHHEIPVGETYLQELDKILF